MIPPYTFRLRPGIDQDIIKLLDRLGSGNRSALIRAALRYYINERLTRRA